MYLMFYIHLPNLYFEKNRDSLYECVLVVCFKYKSNVGR